MPTPTPAILRMCADELRTLASTHERNAAQCEQLLSAVTRLTGTDTWSGRYCTTTDNELTAWKSRLSAGAAELRSEAAGWRRAATRFDREAEAKARAGAAS